ncbi:hypothetical protein BGP_5164 [Beggiatoa sp. PS]|nr:hypothetical protein BGP_5164 [Beggiatoa sp. PS]
MVWVSIAFIGDPGSNLLFGRLRTIWYVFQLPSLATPVQTLSFILKVEDNQVSFNCLHWQTIQFSYNVSIKKDSLLHHNQKQNAILFCPIFSPIR